MEEVLFIEVQEGSAADTGGAGDMDEVLDVAEIERRYNSEWILVEDPELDEYHRVVRGKVAWHSKDRDEVYRKAIERQPRHSASLYTGEMPEDTAILI